MPQQLTRADGLVVEVCRGDRARAVRVGVLEVQRDVDPDQDERVCPACQAYSRA